MKRYQLILCILLAALVTAYFVIGVISVGGSLMAKPERIYILEIKLLSEYPGNEVFLMTYSVSGLVQSVVFPGDVHLEDYMNYLKSIGRVQSYGDAP